ncbi:hypothetical protein [Gordonia sputi]|uniref:Low molecular weight antigen MTB12-like C-terminal domain-containing protein n=1 Tax=Gordonia sputi NBRC 100414 TaxID=1089453 RepID=H5U054_9ACTN|nr:hypothetical protein [Gordonia sputi]NKY94520.1 ABC transporter substrate-binding protein [Gordonia sputi]GAB39112.1 hypothetical protein GOSPT_058_00650 [Gordonia sputi NBRC 100414]
MKFPKFVGAAVMTVAVATSLAACSSSDDSDDVPTVAATTSAAATSEAAASGADAGVTNPNVRPSVATLNAMLNKALDPNVPNSEKTDLVQGSEKDPQLFDKLVKARQDNKDVTYQIFPPVIPAGPNKATVKVLVKLPDNPPTKLDAQIVYDGGRWKLASDSVCPILSGNNIKSAMCTK